MEEDSYGSGYGNGSSGGEYRVDGAEEEISRL